MKRPDWIDDGLYPFESNFMRQEPGYIHYVDEGSGRPVVMLHGNPTWSFLYRKIIHQLSNRYRCIAPDHLGFGLSERPEDFSYAPEAHARNFEEFVQRLELDEITLLCQDWGGPIGLSYALEYPQKVRSVVVMNTWMWPMTESWRAWFFSNFVGGPIGKWLIDQFNLFVEWGMPLATHNTLPDRVMDHYRKPFTVDKNRYPIWKFPRAILGSTPFLADLWGKRSNLSDIPVLIIWGMKDFAFSQPERDRWRTLLPDAPFRPIQEASHFLQEDAGETVAQHVRNFLK